MTRITSRLITVVVIAVAAFAQITHAQERTQATLTGKVTDATGATSAPAIATGHPGGSIREAHVHGAAGAPNPDRTPHAC
jgi:hypothetical protein